MALGRFEPAAVISPTTFHAMVGIVGRQHAVCPGGHLVVEQIDGFVADPCAEQSVPPLASTPLRVHVQTRLPSQNAAAGVQLLATPVKPPSALVPFVPFLPFVPSAPAGPGGPGSPLGPTDPDSSPFGPTHPAAASASSIAHRLVMPPTSAAQSGT